MSTTSALTQVESIPIRPVGPVAPSLPPFNPQAGQRLLLWDVSWQIYVVIGDALPDRPRLRMTYDCGSLEIMTTSSMHEVYKEWICRILEVIAEECNRPWICAGNMTFRREDLERGIEPDSCYWIANVAHVRGRVQFDATNAPPPDLVLEIEITRSALDRMEIYAVLGIPEVWRFDGTAIYVHQLQADRTYATVDRSPTFPQIDIKGITRFLQADPNRNGLSLTRELRAWVQPQLSPPAT